MAKYSVLRTAQRRFVSMDYPCWLVEEARFRNAGASIMLACFIASQSPSARLKSSK